MAIQFRKVGTVNPEALLKTGMVVSDDGVLRSGKEPGFLSKVKTDLGNRFTNIGRSLSNSAKGEQTPVEGALQIVGQGAGAVGDVIGEGISSITPQSVKNIGVSILKTPLGQAGLEAIQGGVQKYESWAETNPRAAADLEAVVNIASLLPAYKGAEVAGKATLKTAVLGTEKLATAAERTGGVTKGIGTKLYEAAIPFSEKEAQLIQQYKATVPLKERVSSFLKGMVNEKKPRLTSATAVEKGIAGPESWMGVQARRETERLWKETIQPSLRSLPDRISTDEMFGTVEKEINKITELSKKKSFKEALDSIKDDYKGTRDFSYEEAQNIKSELDKALPEKMFRGQNVSGAANNVRKLMADFIRNKTYKSLSDVNIRKDYLDYGNLKGLMKLGTNAMKNQKLKGGFGGFVSALVEKGVTPVATISGQVLYKTGDGLYFVSQKGLKKFGEYLDSFIK